jgi:hypothetical protein
MSLDSESTSPAEVTGYREIGVPAGWSEQLVAIVTTCIALLIVAVVAVLMGMA